MQIYLNVCKQNVQTNISCVKTKGGGQNAAQYVFLRCVIKRRGLPQNNTDEMTNAAKLYKKAQIYKIYEVFLKTVCARYSFNLRRRHGQAKIIRAQY